MQGNEAEVVKRSAPTAEEIAAIRAKTGRYDLSLRALAQFMITMTDDDRQRIAELWWAGRLNVGDRVVLESGHEVTCCAVEVGGDEPPHLTFRADPDLSSVRISFVIAGVPE